MVLQKYGVTFAVNSVPLGVIILFFLWAFWAGEEGGKEEGEGREGGKEEGEGGRGGGGGGGGGGWGGREKEKTEGEGKEGRGREGEERRKGEGGEEGEGKEVLIMYCVFCFSSDHWDLAGDGRSLCLPTCSPSPLVREHTVV